MITLRSRKVQQMIYLDSDTADKLRLLSKYRQYHDKEKETISEICIDALQAYFKRHKAEIETAEKEKAGVNNAEN